MIRSPYLHHPNFGDFSKASKNFKSLRILDDIWRVCRYGNALIMTQDKHIPKFNYVCTVKYMNGQLQCSCPLTKVCGLPCVHSLYVASTMSPHWEYHTERDVSVLWWKSYLKSAIEKNV